MKRLMMVPNDDVTLYPFWRNDAFTVTWQNFEIRFKLLCGFFLFQYGGFSRNKKCGKCVQGRWKLPQGQTGGQEGRAGWAAEAGQHVSHQIRIFSVRVETNFSPISWKYEITQLSSKCMRLHKIDQTIPFSWKIPLLFLFSRQWLKFCKTANFFKLPCIFAPVTHVFQIFWQNLPCK